MAHCSPRPTADDVGDDAGMTTETLRFLGRAGLLPEQRADGLRDVTLSPDAAGRLRFIQRAQRLGFSLRDIRQLLAISDGLGSGQDQAQPSIASQVEVIDEKLIALMRMRQALLRFEERLVGRGSRAACPILAALQDEAGD